MISTQLRDYDKQDINKAKLDFIVQEIRWCMTM